jgi:hypothetical protein
MAQDKNSICCNGDCNQGRTCPVRLGTYKPVEAVHQIDEPQTQQHKALARAGLTAIRLAREGDQHAAETIRAQQARIIELERWQEDVRSNTPLLAELRRANARMQELEASESRTIAQRDHCEEVIDRMADAVLGKDRHEWTSAYDFTDAAAEVEDRIAELESRITAAPQAMQAAVPDGWKLVPVEPTREMLDAYVAADGRFHSGRTDWGVMLNAAPAHHAEGVPAPMLVAQPHHCTARTADGSCEECEGHAQAMAEWNAERAAIAATHPTQQGMDAIAALQKVRDIAVSALLTGSLDRQDWIDDMDRIAAQAKQGGAA